ncbi:MAG: VWA domain-containing protein [Gammaproteobacteria bacterium]|nr:VWA domain-containing protein [Gammaproteobacteria bacterium]
MIQFVWPWALALVVLPLLVRLLIPAASRQQDAALKVPFMGDFNIQPSAENTVDLKRWSLILAVIAWLCLVIATARPQWLGEQVDLPLSGRDLMMAVDLSGSMQAEDFQLNNRSTNRLQALKAVAGEFIQRRQGDRLGLILFGTQAYLQTPLTFDRTTVNTLLQEAFINMAGEYTAIGDAIGLAIKRLQNKSSSSRVLILLTDGENTAGEVEPLKAAEIAAEQGMKIYTIGIGAEYIEQQSFFRTFRSKNKAIDEKTLTSIAQITGGRYFRARNTQELEQIYQLLDELEPIEQNSQSFRPITALFYWPLGLALILATLISLIKLGGIRL